MISYDNLVKILKENGLKKSDLTKVLGISSRTVAKISLPCGRFVSRSL